MTCFRKLCAALAFGLAAQILPSGLSAAVLPHQTIPGAAAVPLPAAGLVTPEELEAFLDGAMANALAAHKIAGGTVSVVKDGQIFFAKGYGYADVENRTPVDAATTLFRPGSVSKLFTWTSVMQLVEQGKLDLDADVNQYITQFQIPKTFKAPITLRNIMTHTTGFEDGGLGFLFVDSPERMVPLADALKAHMPARVHPPATDMNSYDYSAYSNWATALAGLIVSNVSGVPFEDYVDQHIFVPLAMQHATFREPLPARLAADMSGAYVMENGAFVKKGFEYIHNFAPAGSSSVSAVDMAHFMIAHLEDGRYGDAQILKPETVDMMHRRAFAGDPHVNGIALGFYEIYDHGRRTINHGGATMYFKSDLMLIPDADVGLFISFNGPDGTVAGHEVREAFMDRYFPAELPKLSPPADFQDKAQDYEGVYRGNRNSFTKIEKLLGAFADARVKALPNGRLVSSNILGETAQWVEIAPDVFRKFNGDDVMAFKRDKSGAVNALITNFSVMSYAKVGAFGSGGTHAVIFGIAVLLFIAAIVTAIVTRRSERDMPQKSRRARWILAAVGVVDILFFVLLGLSVSGGMEDLMYNIPPLLKLALILPFISILLTIASLVFAGVAWKDRYWSLGGRIIYSLTAVLAVLYLLVLNYWNLIGYKFG